MDPPPQIHSRYIDISASPLPTLHPSSSSLRTIHDQLSSALLQSLTSVNQHAAEHPRSKVYAGLAGISLMNFRLSTTALPFLQPTNLLSLSHAQLAHALASDALSPPTSGAKVAFLDTSVGPATLVLLYQLHHLASTSASPRPDADASPPDPPFSHRTCAHCAALLSSALRVALAPPSGTTDAEDGCELLYGRAGLLYALLLLRAALPRSTPGAPPAPTSAPPALRALVRPLTSSQALRPLVDSIIARGQAGAARFAQELESTVGRRGGGGGGGGGGSDTPRPALMWSWHGKRYLGGAHGVAGILQIVLHAPPALLSPHTAAISSTLAYLLSLQDRAGNWPSKAPARRDDSDEDGENDLVQWCHGAPGILPLLATALALSKPEPQPQPASSSHLPTPILPLPPALRTTLLSALTHGAALVGARGLLRKGPGLCHGAAGNAGALFCAADALGRSGAGASRPTTLAAEAAARRCFADGVRLLLRCVELRGTPSFGRGDRPWSLYEGEAGLCAVLAEAVQRVGGVLEGRGGAGAGAVRALGSGLLGYCDLVRV